MHSSFYICGHLRQNRKQDTEARCDLHCASDPGESSSERQPGGNKASRDIEINDMRDSNGDNCQSKNDLCDAKASLPVQPAEECGIVRSGQACEQYPSTGE